MTKRKRRNMLTWVVVLVLVILALPAEAHPHREIRAWPVADDAQTIQLEKEGAYRGRVRAAEICELVDSSRLKAPEATMAWCGLIGENLFHWGKLNLYRTQHVVNFVDCESRGFAGAQNPGSSAAGLGQFVTPFRDHRALRYLGRPVKSWYDGPDNLVVTVGLYVDQGDRHWPNCGKLRPTTS